MGKGTLVIGASHAGVQCASALRDAGYAERIILVGEDDALPYHRPPLSKTFICAKVSEEDIELKSHAFYTDEQVELRRGLRADSICREACTVTLSNGETLEYDNLVLATGSRPRLWRKGEMPGNVHVLRTLADARQIVRTLKATDGTVAIVGGGYVGLELAATVRTQFGRDVVIIEASGRLLSRSASPLLSDWVARQHVLAGSRLLLNTPMVGFETSDGVVDAVVLDGQPDVKASVVILGLGIVPNEELASQAGIRCADGIMVDEFCRTDDPCVYAIGDCTRFSVAQVDRTVRLECVQNAHDQARTVAATIAGNPTPYRPVPWFWSDQMGSKLQTVGFLDNAVSSITHGDIENGKGAFFHFDSEKNLCAAETVNNPAIHMQIRRAMAAGKKLEQQRFEHAGKLDLKV